MSNTQRLKQLAGLTEVATQIDDPDDVEREEDERSKRERSIERIIAVAFDRLGIPIAENGIYYSEDEERQAEVALDADAINIDKLSGLLSSGLSDRFVIEASQDRLHGVHLTLGFRVSPALDQAVLPPSRRLDSRST